MSSLESGARPGTVTFSAWMMFLGALGYLIGFAVNIFLIIQPDEQQLFYGHAASDWYWVIMALLDATLVVGFIWVGRMALAGDYGAGMTITLLALINLVFSFFNIFQGYGWFTLFVSIAVLIANNTRSAQGWYQSHLPSGLA